MSANEKLLPCPFCGGKARINGRHKFSHWGANEDKYLIWTIYVKCNKCHSRGKPINTAPIISDGRYMSFYTTKWWCDAYRNVESNAVFEPYIMRVIAAWNTRYEPPILVDYVKQGNWVYVDKCHIQEWQAMNKCSVCGHSVCNVSYGDKVVHFNYCPNCGAKMSGGIKWE